MDISTIPEIIDRMILLLNILKNIEKIGPDDKSWKEFNLYYGQLNEEIYKAAKAADVYRKFKQINRCIKESADGLDDAVSKTARRKII